LTGYASSHSPACRARLGRKRNFRVELWASYFLPQDRAHIIELLAGLPERVPDETARIDLAAFTAALQAVN
jgi:hypothetical protein